MTKFKKQMLIALGFLLVAAALTVTYFLLKSDGSVAKAPALTAEISGEKLIIKGLSPDKKYLYSTDGGKNYEEIEKGSSELILDVGTICYVKEDGEKSEPAVIGGFGESTKNGRPYIVEKVENEDLNSIFVHNTLDEYTLLHKRSGAYKIEGLEDYEVNEQMLAALRVNSLNLLATRYLGVLPPEEAERYGINFSDPESYFVVTYNKEQSSYKIIIGDKTPDGDGYYAMLEGRPALYVLDTGIESSILLSRKEYVTPFLVDVVEDNYKFMLSTFTLNKNGEKFITIDKAKGEETYGNSATHRVTYPAYNYATNLTNFEEFLNQLLNLRGTATLLYGDEVTPEKLCEYGFFDLDGNDVSAYSFSYKYPAFSEQIYVTPNAEGGYIVYSKGENIVATLPEESLAFLNWDMLLWVSSEIYLLDIEDVESMTFEANGSVARFDLSGEADALTVTANGKLVNTEEFRSLYRSILYVIVTHYSEDREHGEEELRLNVKTEKGEHLDYRFYKKSAQNTFYTLNGFGEFYVSADKIKEVKETAFGFLY